MPSIATFDCKTCFVAFNAHKISGTKIRDKSPLSVVFPQFIDWVVALTADISRTTETLHYPGRGAFAISCDDVVSI